ncbi:MAG TPA: YCF48-related protein [Candidatus Acidoferrales bacterium]|nr:YCF48-related protein [Candidatus Acidoferrales bacterium]
MFKNILSCLIMSFAFLAMTASVEAQSWDYQTNPTIGTADTLGGGKIQFVSSTEGWISLSEGKLLHTTNAGTNWSVVTPFPSDTVWSFSDPSITMSWVSQTHGWKINAIGAGFGDAHGAVIHKTTDGGSTWEKKIISTDSGEVGLQIQFVDDNNGWALIYNLSNGSGSLQKSTDGGDNWTSIASDSVGIFYFVDANNGWTVAGSQDSSMLICHTTNGGVNWVSQYTDRSPGTLNAIQFTDLDNGWVVGDSGKILKTTDGGANWTPITNTGINPLSYSKCLFFLNADTGWIGTNDGIPEHGPDRVILHTTDGGSSWTTSFRDKNNNSAIFSVFFLDANNGWFTGDYGLIGHTTNGGTGVGNDGIKIPDAYSLDQNYPNPFNPSTVISYQLSTVSNVTLKVYDVLGREVETLINQRQAAGSHSVTFNAANLPSGVYFYRLQAGSYNLTKKLLLLK